MVIGAEKLRAICQQLPGYPQRGRLSNHPGVPLGPFGRQKNREPRLALPTRYIYLDFPSLPGLKAARYIPRSWPPTNPASLEERSQVIDLLAVGDEEAQQDEALVP